MILSAISNKIKKPFFKNIDVTMTLYQFNVLSEDEKAAVLWSKGDFVADRMENKFSILLHQVRFF
jgi:hypothetical protein